MSREDEDEDVDAAFADVADVAPEDPPPAPPLPRREHIPLVHRTADGRGDVVRAVWRVALYSVPESALCVVNAKTLDPAWWRSTLPGMHVEVRRHRGGTDTAEGLRAGELIAKMTPTDAAPVASTLQPGTPARVHVVVDGRPAVLTATVRGVLADGTVEVDVVPATMFKITITTRR